MQERKGWEEIWASGEAPDKFGSFAEPNQTVVEWAGTLPPGGRVLDVGCGVGRHVTYLARLGFQMAGVDVSPAGIEGTRLACAQIGAAFEGQVCDMTALPWADEAFDAALSTSAIHHGLRAHIQAALDEIWRVVKPGGEFFVDLMTTNCATYRQMREDAAAGRLTEVEPNTFVDLRPDSKGDDYLPHHICDEADARDLLGRFHLVRFGEYAYVRHDGIPGAKWAAWAQRPSQNHSERM